MVKNMDARKFVFTLIHDPLSDRFLGFPQILHTFQNSQRMDERAARMEERRSLVHPAARMRGGDLVRQDRLDIPRISHPGGRKRKFDRWNHLLWPDSFLMFFSIYIFACYYMCDISKSDLLLK